MTREYKLNTFSDTEIDAYVIQNVLLSLSVVIKRSTMMCLTTFRLFWPSNKVLATMLLSKQHLLSNDIHICYNMKLLITYSFLLKIFPGF